MKHKKKLIKSAKARVTGTIPYCLGKVPHSRKLLSPCSNDILSFHFRLKDCPGRLSFSYADLLAFLFSIDKSIGRDAANRLT
jgi:hypothetical protein